MFDGCIGCSQEMIGISVVLSVFVGAFVVTVVLILVSFKIDLKDSDI